jgi:hypothetical protein
MQENEEKVQLYKKDARGKHKKERAVIWAGNLFS